MCWDSATTEPPAFFHSCHLHLRAPGVWDEEPQLAVRTSVFLGWIPVTTQNCFTRWWIIVADDRSVTETSALELINISKTWLWRKNQQSCSCDDWTGTELLLKLFTIHFFPLSLSSYLSSILHIWIIPVWTDVTGRFQLNLIWCPCTQQQLGDTN